MIQMEHSPVQGRVRAQSKLEIITLRFLLVLPLEQKGWTSRSFPPFKQCFLNVSSYTHISKPNTRSGKIKRTSSYLFYQVLFQFQAFLSSFG